MGVASRTLQLRCHLVFDDDRDDEPDTDTAVLLHDECTGVLYTFCSEAGRPESPDLETLQYRLILIVQAYNVKTSMSTCRKYWTVQCESKKIPPP